MGHLKRALSLVPSYDEARVALGQLQVDTREYAAANETLSRVAGTSPLSRGGRFLQGMALLELGRYREAAGLYAELSAQDPTPAVLNNHALALLRMSGPNPAPPTSCACGGDGSRERRPSLQPGFRAAPRGNASGRFLAEGSRARGAGGHPRPGGARLGPAPGRPGLGGRRDVVAARGPGPVVRAPRGARRAAPVRAHPVLGAPPLPRPRPPHRRRAGGGAPGPR
jgi:hypothetical protein